MFKFHFQSFSLFLSVFILITFFGFLFAWTGPTSLPPGSNIPSPINLGTSDQSKAGRLSATEFYDTDNSSFYINPSGDSMISGMLSLGGDLYDLTNSKKIYDSTTGKFDPSVMPYEKGDLVSDWATSSYTSGYYVPPSPSDVLCGVSFGRGETGMASTKTCYTCSNGSIVPATVDGAAATSLGCTAGDEGCRRCDNGTCTYYTDGQQHNCSSGYSCDSGSCILFSTYCSTHNGVATAPDGSKVFCEGGLMWSQTASDGNTWYGSRTYCDNLTYAGFSDWYLPEKTVLAALYGTDSNHLGCSSSSCTSWDTYCCSSNASGGNHYYWSNSYRDANTAYMVDFNGGSTSYAGQGLYYSVRCARQYTFWKFNLKFALELD